MRASGSARAGTLATLPFAAMLAVAAGDVLAGPEVGLLALFSLGPALACVSGSVRRAVVVGVRIRVVHRGVHL